MSSVRDLLQWRCSHTNSDAVPPGKNRMATRKALCDRHTQDRARSQGSYVISNCASNHDSTAVSYGTVYSDTMYSSVQPTGAFPLVLGYGGTDVENKYWGPGRNVFDRELELEQKRYDAFVKPYREATHKQALLEELVELNAANSRRSSQCAETAALPASCAADGTYIAASRLAEPSRSLPCAVSTTAAAFETLPPQTGTDTPCGRGHHGELPRRHSTNEDARDTCRPLDGRAQRPASAVPHPCIDPAEARAVAPGELPGTGRPPLARSRSSRSLGAADKDIPSQQQQQQQQQQRPMLSPTAARPVARATSQNSTAFSRRSSRHMFLTSLGGSLGSPYPVGSRASSRPTSGTLNTTGSVTFSHTRESSSIGATADTPAKVQHLGSATSVMASPAPMQTSKHGSRPRPSTTESVSPAVTSLSRKESMSSLLLTHVKQRPDDGDATTTTTLPVRVLRRPSGVKPSSPGTSSVVAHNNKGHTANRTATAQAAATTPDGGILTPSLVVRSLTPFNEFA